MRILRLDLTAFGCFSDRQLDLSAGADDQDELRASGRYGLHVLYGPNEAGKSTSLRALIALLYGIETQSRDNFLHPYDSLRIGGRLESDQGEPLECIRRKGLKRTFRGPDDAAEADAGLLARMLGSIDRATFEAQFGLNDRRLREGGLQILEGKGDVGEILFAAGAGLERLAAVRKQLVAEAEKLFKPRASNPRINQILAQLAEVRKAKAAALLTPAHYEERAGQLAEQERERAAAKTRVANLSAERSDLTRRRDALPLVAQRQRLAQELAQLPPTTALRPEFADDHRRVREGLIASGQACRQYEAACAALAGELAALTFDEPLVASGDMVRQLFSRLAAYENTLQDRVNRRTEEAQLQQQAAQILRELGLAHLDLDAALALRPSPPARVRLSELGNRRQALEERGRHTERRAAELAEDLARAKAQWSELPEPPSTRLLAAAIQEAQRDGNIEERLADDEVAVERLADELATMLRHLPGFAGALADLAAIRVPTPGVIERHQKAIQAAEAAVARAEEQLAVRTKDVARHRAELDHLVADLQAPTRDELTNARGRRDAGWRVVRGVLEGEEDNEAAEEFVSDYPLADGELPRAYELALTDADHVADRLWTSAGAIARQEQQRNALEHAEQQRQAAEQSLAAAQGVLADAEAAWEAVWQGTGVLAEPPGAMLDWLDARDEILDREQELARLRAGTERQRDRIAALQRELAGRLKEAGSSERGDSRLAAMIVRAQEMADRLTEARHARDQLAAKIAELERELPPAEREQQASEADLATWEAQWQEAVARLHLTSDVTAAAVNTVLAQLDVLSGVAMNIKDKQQRIAQMSDVLARFERDVAAVTSSLAPHLAELAPHLATAQLHDRLRAADTAHTKHEDASRKLKQSKKDLEDARGKLARAEQELAALCREAGGAAAEELTAVYERWRQRRQVEKELTGVEEHLWKLAAPRSPEEFLAAAHEWDVDRIAARLGEIAAESEAAAERQESLTQAVAVERKELAKYDTRDTAARAAEEEQGLLAALRQESLRYARAQVASGVLAQAIDNYRTRNQGPILEEASRILARLTGGSLEKLATDYDDRDKLVLVGVRPDHKVVRHDAMSDGTRDQLYLALRLASLKQYLASAPEKLPLIVDDILVHFDDDRSAATLEVLAELSHQTQVIFFTHHAHLVELAQKHVPAEDLFVQPLEAAMAQIK